MGKIKEPTPSKWELSSARVLQASSRYGGIVLSLAGFSGRKKRIGGAHRVQPRPFEGPSRKQGFYFRTNGCGWKMPVGEIRVFPDLK